MITALIAKPPSHSSEVAEHNAPLKRKVPRNDSASMSSVHSTMFRTNSEGSRTDFNEERYWVGLILWIFAAFVLPALLGLVYLILNPESFQ